MFFVGALIADDEVGGQARRCLSLAQLQTRTPVRNPIICQDLLRPAISKRAQA